MVLSRAVEPHGGIFSCETFDSSVFLTISCWLSEIYCYGPVCVFGAVLVVECCVVNLFSGQPKTKCLPPEIGVNLH